MVPIVEYRSLLAGPISAGELGALIAIDCMIRGTAVYFYWITDTSFGLILCKRCF